MAEKHPELAVAFMKGMIRVGRWANEYKHAAGGDPRQADVSTWTSRIHTEGIKHIDLVPNLSPQNLASVEIGKNFMAAPRLHQERLRCVQVGRGRNSWNRRQKNCSSSSGKR